MGERHGVAVDALLAVLQIPESGLFNIYMKLLGEVTGGLGPRHHQYMDGMQLYLKLLSNPRVVVQELGHSLGRIGDQMRASKLKATVLTR